MTDKFGKLGDDLVEQAKEREKFYIEQYGSAPSDFRFKVSDELWEVKAYRRQISATEKRRIKRLQKDG